MTPRSQPSVRRLSFTLALPLALLLLALPVAGCGKKQPPKPPPRMVPAATTDLVVQQRGMELLLSFSYPATTVSGMALSGLESVEVWELVKPLAGAEGEGETEDEAAEAAEEPEVASEVEPQVEPEVEPAEDEPGDEPGESEASEGPAAPADQAVRPEDRVEANPAEFTATAQIAITLTGVDLADAVSGDRILVRLPLSSIPPPDRAEARIFAVKSIAGKRLFSTFSNLVVIVPRVPPSPPVIVDVEPGQKAVELTWSSESAPEGFRVYRREVQARTYGEALATVPPEERSYADASARFGNRYVYTVTALASKRPLVESAVSSEHEINYQDRFPPPPPRNLVVLAETGRVRLLWEPSDADDVAGYLVLRRRGGEEFQPLTAKPVRELEYLDADVTRGETYTYRVLAVDVTGNQGEGGEETAARVP